MSTSTLGTLDPREWDTPWLLALGPVGAWYAAKRGYSEALDYLTPQPPPATAPTPPAPKRRQELQRPDVWAQQMSRRTAEQWRWRDWFPSAQVSAGASVSDDLLVAALIVGGVALLMLVR